MGLSRAIARFRSKNDRRVLLLGLDSAGKSTVFNILTTGQAGHTVPTMGYATATMRHGKYRLDLWDVGGEEALRPYWRHHFTGCQGVIFVIDGSDNARVEAVRKELNSVLQDLQLAATAVLIMLNKQDMGCNVNEKDLGDIDINNVHVQRTIAANGSGLHCGLDWLCSRMKTLS